MRQITLIRGDGIGPEVTDSARKVLDQLTNEFDWSIQNAGIEVYEKCGELVPQTVFDSIERTRLVLKGPIATPIGEGFRSINVMLRKKYDLFCNLRPILSIPGVKSRYEAIDLVIFRENTEDLYAGIEEAIDSDTRHSLKVITRFGSTRIIRESFDFARKNKRKKVTLVHKANIMKETDGLFLSVGREISKEYPDITFEEIIVDNMCMQLVINPNQFDVIVTMNLYGDILSDLCAGLVGGLGVVPGANIGESIAIFEAVHGSAPTIAGKNLANPTAMLLTSAMMLDYIGMQKEANKLRDALLEVLRDEKNHTTDLGGNCTTTAFTEAICKELES